MAEKPRIRVKAQSRPVLADGLTNVVANLGTSRDKAYSSAYTVPMLSDMDVLNAYRGAWLPRKIVEIPALDSCRQWRDWEGQPEQVDAIEAEEERLGVKGKVLQARIAARLFGGAALLIGTGEANPALPLNPETVKRGGIKYLTLIYKRQLSALNIETDPASPYFNQPSLWLLSGGVNSALIHPSRLVLFIGASTPDPGLSASAPGWGDPVLYSVFDAIRSADATAANIASLVFEAKVDTVGIPDLMNKLGDPGYETTLLKRWALAETGKGINGTLMHDAEEQLGQKTASFASLPDVLDRFMQIVSGAADIPMTRLFGQSPAGMSATGESDLRNYYDRIKAAQSLEMEPALAVLDECLIRSALGSRPPEVDYDWCSLWQTSEKERADIGKVKADTIKTLRDTGIIPAEPLSEAAIEMLDQDGVLPGLQAAVEEYFGEHPEELDPAETVPADPVDSPDIGDSAPRTLYVRRDVLNAAEIIAWAKEQGFKTTLPAADLHVTVAYSRTPVDWMKMGSAWEAKIEVPEGGPRQMEAFGDAKVLLFASNELQWRHAAMTEAGATWDHPEYQPNITISYAADAPELSAVQPYRGKIVLGPEVFEEVKEDWQSGITEDARR